MKLTRNFISAPSVRKDLEQFYARPLTRVSFELIVSIITVVLFALFALRPTLLTMSDLLREIQEKQQLDQDLGEKISALATAQSEYSTYQPQIQALDQAILQQSSLEEVAYYLESLLSESGLGVQRVAFGQLPVETKTTDDPSRNPVLTQYQVQVVVEGDLVSLQNFLQRVEQVKPLFSVQGWTLSPTEAEDRPPLEAAINLGVYIYQAPATPVTQGSTANTSLPASTGDAL